MTPNEDPAELAQFAELAARWWDPEGPLKPLHVINPVRLQYIERLVDLRGAQLCDVGAGGGILAEAAAAAGARVTAIDRNATLIDTARLHAADSGFDIRYEATDIAAFAAEHAQAFDVVTCLELLEHVPDPPSLVADTLRMVRPGGLAVFSTINRTLPAYLTAVLGAEYLMNLLPKGTHDYRRFLRPAELARFVREAGATLSDLTGIRYVPLVDRAYLKRSLAVNYIAAARV